MITVRKCGVSAPLVLGFALAGLALNAAAAEKPSPRFGEDLVVNLDLPKGAAKRAVPAQTWRFDGVAKFAEEGADFEAAWLQRAGERGNEIDAKASADVTIRGATQRWIAVNVETGLRYRVEMPAEIANSLYREAVRSGDAFGKTDALGATTQEKALDDSHAKGWSDGLDSRTRRFDNTAYPYRAMGQLGGGRNSGCSGTLIGRRHVLTAAHCLYDRGDDVFVSLAGTRFRPGREGTCNDASCEPYGAHTATWYYTPEAFMTSDTDWTYDYGIMVLGTAPGDTTGWLGYAAISEDDLRTYCDDSDLGGAGRCYNRGYPGCGFSEAPASCEQGWAYQDVNNCEIGGFGSKGADGWNSRVSTACDFSRGHSGSALFTDAWPGGTKVVFGVASTHSCTMCTASDDFPNVFRRVTPEVLDAIAYFKSAKP